MKKAIYFILTIFFIIFISIKALDFLQSYCYDPPRPSNIPNNSKWAGGCDGGFWIDINFHPQKIQTTIYTENGKLYEKKEFISNRTYTSYEIIAYDGYFLYIKDKTTGETHKLASLSSTHN